MVGRTRKRIYDDEENAPTSTTKQTDTAGAVTPRIPLGYESLKCVLEYLEPNRRFEVFRRLPSVRTTEAMIPLKIKELKFQENSVTIDRVTYFLGIYRELKESVRKPRIPSVITRDNNLRGTPYVIDQYGYRAVEFDEVFSPGDISLLERPRDKMTRQVAQRELRLLEQSPEMVRMGEKQRLDEIYFLKHFVTHRPPPFEHFIQLTVEERGKEKQIRRIPYTIKLYQAMKIMTSTLFHHKTIYVECLGTKSCEMILRLPPNLKFHVQTADMRSHASEVLSKLKPIFTDSSFPLKSLKTNELDDNDYILKQDLFEKLIVRYSIGIHQNYHLLPKVTHLESDHYFYYRNFIQNWLREHRSIGTRLAASQRKESDAMMVLSNLKNEVFNFIMSKKRCLTIRMNELSMIRGTVEANPDEKSEQKWIVRFEVVPIE